MTGVFSLVLHAHLPFVRHPTHAEFLEEDWLYEAISESYLPLLNAFGRLANDRVPFRVTVSLSPPLLAMLSDPLLKSRYSTRLDQQCELAEKEVRRTRKEVAINELSRFYRDLFHQLRHDFHHRFGGDLVGAFKALREEGCLELITSSATHGFLPLLQSVPETVRAQLAVGASAYRAAFGAAPDGIWLPECGFYPGLERLLARQELRFFFVETHGIADAVPKPIFGVYAPVYTPSGVAAFGRDPTCSREIWSAEAGYPGDPLYRDFYRDLGWDAPYEYIRPYVQPTGGRKGVGIKYFRITGSTDQKQPYRPSLAFDRAAVHATDFLASRRRQFAELSSSVPGRQPIVVAPYDAELFGHWWFEGPIFLESLIRGAAGFQSDFSLGTPGDYLRQNPEHQVSALKMSSWGEGGYAGRWLNESNSWIYPHLHHCGTRMVSLARQFSKPTDLQRRVLNQAARELLLAQSSDWAFIIRVGAMAEYATRRTRDHIQRFLQLDEQLRNHRLDLKFLAEAEGENNLFQGIDYRVYATKWTAADDVI